MDSTAIAPISIPVVLFNLSLGLLLSVLLAIYYTKLGDSLSNRSKFAPLLPLLSMITLLVISVVKSSLALSLGLVGALSIVRFRTAIKDPEELMFLFFAISIGLGLGADQRILTLISFVIIMGYLIARKAINKTLKLSPHNNLYLNVSLPLGSENNESAFDFINTILGEELSKVDLRRFDTDGKELRLVFYFKSNKPSTVARIANRIQEKYATALISVVEQNNLLGG
ncbi:MAG: DUF4956 domain-containing protein [Chloroflexota bacterium]|nr:MAG: DUF4956 domain-containing protein [Chloroflexota bacterium]